MKNKLRTDKDVIGVSGTFLKVLTKVYRKQIVLAFSTPYLIDFCSKV